MVISPEATGDIDLDGVDEIGGSLRSERGLGVTSISSSTLRVIHENLILGNMTQLRTVSLPELLWVGQVDGPFGRGPDWHDGIVILENLPELTELNLKNLNRLGQFRVIKLPKWEEIDSHWAGFNISSDNTTGRASVVELRDVGLKATDSLGGIFGYQFPTGPWIDNITISGIPNLQELFIDYDHIKALSVAGNGNLTLAVSSETIDEFDVSGVSRDVFDNRLFPNIGNLTTWNNSFTTMNFPWGRVSELTIEDNANFTGFKNVNASWFDWTATELEFYWSRNDPAKPSSIRLRGVPAMDMTPNQTHLTGGSVADWWDDEYCTTAHDLCMRNMSTVVLEGNISNDFL